MADVPNQCTQIVQSRANMGGHSSKSCTFREPAATPPPPVPFMIVSGNGVPSPNGDYYSCGDYAGYPAFKNETEDYYLWFLEEEECYAISDGLGIISQTTWYKGSGDTEITGTYQPYMEVTGNPIVIRS